jgi:hypothetical protein
MVVAGTPGAASRFRTSPPALPVLHRRLSPESIEDGPTVDLRGPASAPRARGASRDRPRVARATRGRSRVALATLLLLAHGAIVVELVRDRIAVRREAGIEPTGRLTLWVATPRSSARPERKATDLPPPRPRVEPALPRLEVPLIEIAAPAPSPAVAAPSAVPDPRLTGSFADEAPATPRNGSAAAASGAASGALRLELGPGFYAQEREREKHLSPAEEARRDPRSNRLVLSPAEKRMIAFGEVECIAWQRMPDGSIYRGPGHWHRVTDVQPGTHEVQECVR